MIQYKYEVIDSLGRRWARTLTASKARKIADRMKREKNLDCIVKVIA